MLEHQVGSLLSPRLDSIKQDGAELSNAGWEPRSRGEGRLCSGDRPAAQGSKTLGRAHMREIASQLVSSDLRKSPREQGLDHIKCL